MASERLSLAVDDVSDEGGSSLLLFTMLLLPSMPTSIASLLILLLM